MHRVNYQRIQRLLPDFNRVQRALPDFDRVQRLVNVSRVQQLLPRFAGTPKRAVISGALIAGLAAGPIAGIAVTANAAPAPTGAVAATTARGAAPAGPQQAGPQQAGPQPAAPQPAGPQPAGPQPAAPQPAAPPSPAPSAAQLEPDGMPSPDTQSTLDLDGAQIDNAHTIVAAAQAMNLPPRAAVIAVATSMQESKLINYGDLGGANDHDSLGLFQQRPSSGWGSPDQLTDPTYAATAFLRALVQVPGWDSMPLTDAAQTVQVSAFGDRYAQWEQQATDLVLSSYHTGPYANAG
jgi:hypothetical protein